MPGPDVTKTGARCVCRRYREPATALPGKAGCPGIAAGHDPPDRDEAERWWCARSARQRHGVLPDPGLVPFPTAGAETTLDPYVPAAWDFQPPAPGPNSAGPTTRKQPEMAPEAAPTFPASHRFPHSAGTNSARTCFRPTGSAATCTSTASKAASSTVSSHPLVVTDSPSAIARPSIHAFALGVAKPEIGRCMLAAISRRAHSAPAAAPRCASRRHGPASAGATATSGGPAGPTGRTLPGPGPLSLKYDFPLRLHPRRGPRCG